MSRDRKLKTEKFLCLVLLLSSPSVYAGTVLLAVANIVQYDLHCGAPLFEL